MATETKAAQTEAPKAASTAAWKRAGVHYPLLPSGTRVGLRIPDLAAMIETGQVPNHLLSAALGLAKAQNEEENKIPTPEELTENAAQDREFTDLLVLEAVVEPKLTEDDVKPGGIPQEDKQFIVALATRQRDLDAEGEHIAGLTKSEKFRRFRGLGEFDTSLEGL
jgi:hypothetical protein